MGTHCCDLSSSGPPMYPCACNADELGPKCLDDPQIEEIDCIRLEYVHVHLLQHLDGSSNLVRKVERERLLLQN